MMTEAKLKKYKEKSASLKSLILTDRQLCDIELIMNGAFSPLNGFLGESDYNSVLSDMRLKSGEVWPIPIMLDVDENYINDNSIEKGTEIALREKEGFLIAFLTVTDIWSPDKNIEAEAVFNTTNTHHPGVNHLFSITKNVYIGGKITSLQSPKHYDYPLLRHAPFELKEQFEKLGSFSNMTKYIPGLNKIKNLEDQEKNLIWIKAMIQSMTNEEREKPEIINGKRRQRIAKGSGRNVSEVNKLIKQFSQMKTMIKKIGSMKMGKLPFKF